MKIAVDDARDTVSKTGRIRQVESSSLLIVPVSSVVDKRKEQCKRFLAMNEELRKHGSMSVVHCRFFCNLLLAFRRCSQGGEVFIEAVRRQARRTPYPLLVACDTNTEPETFSQGRWYSDKYMTMKSADQLRKMESWFKERIQRTGGSHQDVTKLKKSK